MSVSISSGNLIQELRTLAAGIQNNVSQAIRVATNATFQDAKNTTLFKDRTGDMRGEIGESVDGLTGKVFRGRKRYMGFVANGTPPHVIEAHGRALRFVVNGSVLFRKRVNHPGAAPRPFMQHAHDVGKLTLAAVGERFVNSAIRRFNA